MALVFNVVASLATRIDSHVGSVRLAEGQALNYDSLVPVPDITTRFDVNNGCSMMTVGLILQAWKADWLARLLRDQLHAIEDGGAVIVANPLLPSSYSADPTLLVAQDQHNIHVIGDAASTGLPESPTLANSKANVSVSAIGAIMHGDPG